MKIVVIQETVKMPNLTAAEGTEHWNQLKKLPNVELKIVIPEKYLMPEEYHDIIGDADAVLGLWVSDKVINEEWHRVAVKAFKVDGKRIKPDTFYMLKDGKAVKED